ncbi:uncharacterized protein LOC105165626 [Sesamum indicum]|uniref:Uncharacterized protein LOC105165626 n=1 Tax=Sesamum indicum TaxID=4182 RepID=A0A6I9TPG3_SESIN|nr:uncharacterized protein LOC105165626 [Sesamum indicum]XP_011083001.1 uncharacterized protein LOC105165626 [Sesamum indicum]XP_011083002.1 uncharacterized protein LOC105165626 [Sesamum indicum]XP_020550154.1 uncharacterized protein LOC105165626 [Sesamum indicum]
MLMKDLMEDKKLNLNQPLLSVRRHSTMSNTQKLDERKVDSARPVMGRIPHYRSELKSGPVGKPGAVPFQWEQAPGRPKEEIKAQTRNCSKPLISPRLPPGRCPKANSRLVSPSTNDNKIQDVNIHCDSLIALSLDESIKGFGSSRETIEEGKSSDSGDCGEAYVDALDTLSRTGSFSLNCSTSGLTGMDDLDAKTSGIFLTDPQTQDKFLPAVKGVSKTPQYAPQKQSIVDKQPQQFKKIVKQDESAIQHGPSFAKLYSHHQNIKDEAEEEESNDDCHQHGNLSAVCCLLPRLCLNSSVCILNPVTAMSMTTRLRISRANRIRPTSSSAGSYAKTEDQCKSNISEIKPVGKLRTAELKENKTSVKSESGQLESHNTLAYCDEPLSFLEDTKHTGTQGYESCEKSFRTFKELLADEGSPKELESGGGVVEKTVYVDTVQDVEDMSSCSPNTQDTGVPRSREEHYDLNAKRIDQMHVMESSLEDFKMLNTAEGDAKPNGVSSNDKSNGKSRRGMPTAFGENQEPNLHSTTTENIEVTEKEATKYVQKQPPRATTLGNSHAKYSKFPVPPPLPKSPSDSWLCRTLPSISSKKASQHSKARRGDIKWEAMVKSKKVQHHNLHYSEDLLTPAPET